MSPQSTAALSFANVISIVLFTGDCAQSWRQKRVYSHLSAGGPLDGLKLIGFAVWERRNGGRMVTFPARQYSVNGERRSVARLRPVADTVSQDRLRDIVLAAYCEHEAALAETA